MKCCFFLIYNLQYPFSRPLQQKRSVFDENRFGSSNLPLICIKNFLLRLSYTVELMCIQILVLHFKYVPQSCWDRLEKETENETGQVLRMNTHTIYVCKTRVFFPFLGLSECNLVKFRTIAFK